MPAGWWPFCDHGSDHSEPYISLTCPEQEAGDLIATIYWKTGEDFMFHGTSPTMTALPLGYFISSRAGEGTCRILPAASGRNSLMIYKIINHNIYYE
jgi:hypothetical protein